MTDTPLRITIVTHNWPPRNAIGTHRPYSWARYWSAAGHNIRVLTPKKYSYDAPLDLHLPVLDGVTVVQTEYGNAAGVAARTLLASPFARMAGKIYRMFRDKGHAPANPREAWVAALAPQINALSADCDVVVSTFGPKACHTIGSALKASNPDLTWVADYRDLWSQNHSSTWSPGRRETEQNEELATVGRYADLVTTVSEDLSDQLRRLMGKPTVTITNGFEATRAEIEAAINTERPRVPGPIRIVYTGKIYPGLRDPLPLLEVIAECEDDGSIPKGSVQMHFYGGQTEVIDDLLRTGRYRHFLRSHGHVPREIALKAQAEADFLLLLESPDVSARGVLTGKIFEYIAAGRPIICVGSDPEYEIGLLLQRTATGRVLDRAEMASTIIGRLQTGALPVWFAPKIEQVLPYSRQTQALSMLAQVLKRHG